jgi:hypothetical protein
MSLKEPAIFQTWKPFLRIRQMVIAAAFFKAIGWENFNYGHAKIFGIILWHYEGTKDLSFNYSVLLRKNAYGKTQNYALLKILIEKDIIERKRNGSYQICEEHEKLAIEILTLARIFTTKS